VQAEIYGELAKAYAKLKHPEYEKQALELAKLVAPAKGAPPDRGDQD